MQLSGIENVVTGFKIGFPIAEPREELLSSADDDARQVDAVQHLSQHEDVENFIFTIRTCLLPQAGFTGR